MKTYSVAVAGTTKRTKRVVEKLLTDSQSRFSIPWILTPGPREIGRNQALTKNPLHKFAETKKITTVLINKKINSEIGSEIEKLSKPDFLLVVDFGFLVPKWLLSLPKKHPLNIHPSLLPRWRGSSPGQFVLLSGEQQSAVTIMVMDEKLDQGPTLKQIEFKIEPNWTQEEYYQHSFDLACNWLGDVIENLAMGQLKPQPQPIESPTPVAKQLAKKDSFIEWELLEKAMEGNKNSKKSETKTTFGPLSLPPTPKNIANACRAFYPWPKLWTMMPDGGKDKVSRGGKRLIIHSCRVETNAETGQEKLILDEVQLEGKQKKKVKNNLL